MVTITELENLDIGALIEDADQGDLDAMNLAVTKMIIEGYIVKDAEPEIIERYISYLSTLAEAGSTVAMIQLADSYASGEEIDQDAGKAIEYYEMAAGNGEMFGYESIGMMYFEGNGVSQDFDKAEDYFSRCKGHLQNPGNYALAEIYRLGLHKQQDLKKACSHYQKIVSKTFPGIERDYYYWKAAYRLGVARHYGQGCKKDLKKSLSLLEIAKKFGDTEREIIPGEAITKEGIDHEWARVNEELGNF